jgi:hypothetical protein
MLNCWKLEFDYFDQLNFLDSRFENIGKKISCGKELLSKEYTKAVRNQRMRIQIEKIVIVVNI